MKKALILSTLLGLALAACVMEPSMMDPTTGTLTFGVETPPPTPPEPVAIPDTGPVPTIPYATQIIVSIYPQGEGYAVAGVDANRGNFTFIFTGNSPSLMDTLRELTATGIPLVVYTAPLDILGYPAAPSRGERSAASVVRPMEDRFDLDGGTDPDGGLDPDGGTGDKRCEVCDPPISDDPGGIKKPGGDDWLTAFAELSWRTALKISITAQPIHGATTGPVGP